MSAGTLNSLWLPVSAVAGQCLITMTLVNTVAEAASWAIGTGSWKLMSSPTRTGVCWEDSCMNTRVSTCRKCWRAYCDEHMDITNLCMWCVPVDDDEYRTMREEDDHC